MAAEIQKGMHLASSVTHHQHRIFAHICGKEITGVRDLALMTQKEPAAGENPLELLLIDVLFNEDAAIDQSVIVVDQTSHIYRHLALRIIHCRRFLRLRRPPSGRLSGYRSHDVSLPRSRSRWPIPRHSVEAFVPEVHLVALRLAATGHAPFVRGAPLPGNHVVLLEAASGQNTRALARRGAFLPLAAPSCRQTPSEKNSVFSDRFG